MIASIPIMWRRVNLAYRNSSYFPTSSSWCLRLLSRSTNSWCQQTNFTPLMFSYRTTLSTSFFPTAPSPRKFFSTNRPKLSAWSSVTLLAILISSFLNSSFIAIGTNSWNSSANWRDSWRSTNWGKRYYLASTPALRRRVKLNIPFRFTKLMTLINA